MSKYKNINDIIEQFQGIDFLKIDEMDNCILGYDFDGMNVRLIYSVSKILTTIIKAHKCSQFDAIEYFELNIRGFRSGDDNEPILCQDDF